MLRSLIAALSFVFACLSLSPLAAASNDIATTWRLLDYVSVDYGEAVADGRVASASEYGEMQEFTATVAKQLAALPENPAKPSLVSKAANLRALVGRKAPAAQVATEARQLGGELLRAYPVPLAPPKAPDLARGSQLFQTTCAACHGAEGRGDGPLAKSLNPKPVNFTDRARASQRSTFALEQVIAQGIDGTAMQSFANLPTQDRWALAFKIGTFAYPQNLIAEGKRVWDSDPSVRARLPDLAALAAITPKALADQIGEAKANAVIAYLRANPAAVQSQQGASLAVTKAKLAASVAAYRNGDRPQAKRLALSAYLDGFEPVEPILAARDAALMQRIERAMGDFRVSIDQGRSVTDLETQGLALNALFGDAEQALAPSASSAVSTFLSALTILVREGVEVLLIVVAMIAFLRKGKREDALPYVHCGWIVALLAGGLTWFVATRLISISGAGRELTEGFGGIFAAFVLVFVGIWMHGKAQVGAWQKYVHEKMNRALSGGSRWLLFGLAFGVVYREVFETILFYAAMWEDSPAALLAGVVVGSVLLAAIAWALLRYSAKLPISQFFRYSSWLIAVLAVVLAGKGVSAIQEAGLIGITPLPGIPSIDALGLQPSLQVVLAQLLALLALLLGFNVASRRTSTDPQ